MTHSIGTRMMTSIIQENRDYFDSMHRIQAASLTKRREAKNTEALTNQCSMTSETKQQELLSQVKEFGQGNSKHTDASDYLSRIFMRHPKEETKQILYKLHEAIKSSLENLPEEVLDWILKGLKPGEARGGFVDPVSLQTFLGRNPQNMRSSRLMTGVETILAAITYRVIQRERPKDSEDKKFQDQFDQLFKQFDFPQLDDYEERYPDARSRICTDQNFKQRESTCIIYPRSDLSSASDCDNSSSLHQQPLPPFGFFRKQYDEGTPKNLDTWYEVAYQSGVPLRLGMSGSAIICLRTAERLLKNHLQKPVDKKDLNLIAAMLMATYHRAGFHSIAEVLVAYHHYQEIRQLGGILERDDPDTIARLSPKPALENGFRLMEHATKENYQPSMRVIANEYLKNCHNIVYHLKKRPNVLYEFPEATQSPTTAGEFMDSEENSLSNFTLSTASRTNSEANFGNNNVNASEDEEN